MFLSVLNMSITASYVILFVVIIRLMLKRAPKVISYALWSVVAFRLLIPFSFKSIYSLLPRKTSTVPIQNGITYQQSPLLNSGIRVLDTITSESLLTPATGASVSPLQVLIETGAYIWIAGIIALLIYSFVSILILKRQLRAAQFVEKNIFEARNLKTPFVLGLIRPKIYLPVGLKDDERDYILLHEQTHISRKDHIIKILAFLVLSIHWFNPLVWIAYIVMSIDMELSCDERVLKEMDEEVKKPYANSLLSLAAGRHILNGSPNAFSEGTVKWRIKNVLNYKKPAFWFTLISVLFALVIGIGLLANPEDKGFNEIINSNKGPGENIQLAVTQDDNQELTGKVANDMVNIIDGFSEIDKHIKDYTFDVSYDGDLEWDERVYSIHGTYDLNGDGQADSINAVLIAGNEDGSYIEVNGMKLELNFYNPTGAANIIDLDSKDAYTEVAIFDDGASGDPAFTFIRYDGTKLYTVGTIDRYALMDGQGKFISWFHMANNFKPKFFSALGEFKNNEYVITNHDIEQYKGKTYEVNGTGFFVPLDNNPEDHFEHMVWDSETLREFNETKIKLLDIHMSPDDPTLNCFYVELPDGERGLLYFWIGD
jgi:beta-lactamase regulating signal transducer with metallopeptidase domain